MNWDYRYCWLRDTTFTMTPLLNGGFQNEAGAWMNWLLRAIASAPDKMPIMYRVSGGRQVQGRELSHLPGCNGAQPMRVGNQAATQRQLDVYGEALDSMALCVRAGIDPGARARDIATRLVAHVERIWREPDQGMWETRGTPE